MPRRTTDKRTRAGRSAAQDAPQTVAAALLARRDFCSAELRARLRAHTFTADSIEWVINDFIGRGVLNDARYAENYVSWHAGRGQGPLRIAADLRKHGVDEALIEAALAGGPDWAALAVQVYHSRFGPQAPASWREKARQMRFLQYRGFSSDHIRAATGADPDWTEGP